MTYKQLKEKLMDLSEEQLGMDVTVYVSKGVCLMGDEYYGGVVLEKTEEADVLDYGHPVLTVRNW